MAIPVAALVTQFGTKGAKETTGKILGVGAAFAGVVAGGKRAIDTFVDFETEMNNVKALSGATAEEMDALRDKAREMGLSTKFSAKEAAEGMGFLSQAGYSAEQQLAAIPHTLNLAAAGMLSLGEATDIATDVLSGFQGGVEDLPRFVDVLAKTAASANTNVTMLGEAMSYVGPVAAQTGQSFEATSAAVATLSNAGIKGSRAGTALRSIMLSLASVTAKGQLVLDKYNIATKDAKGNMIPLTAIMRQFRDSGASASEMMAVFGRRFSGAAGVLAEGAEKARELEANLLLAAGAAQEMADTQMEGLVGTMTTFKSVSEGAFERLGSLLEGPVGAGIEALTAVLQTSIGVMDRIEELREESDESGVRALGTGSGTFGGWTSDVANYITPEAQAAIDRAREQAAKARQQQRTAEYRDLKALLKMREDAAIAEAALAEAAERRFRQLIAHDGPLKAHAETYTHLYKSIAEVSEQWHVMRDRELPLVERGVADLAENEEDLNEQLEETLELVKALNDKEFREWLRNMYEAAHVADTLAGIMGELGQESAAAIADAASAGIDLVTSWKTGDVAGMLSSAWRGIKAIGSLFGKSEAEKEHEEKMAAYRRKLHEEERQRQIDAYEEQKRLEEAAHQARMDEWQEVADYVTENLIIPLSEVELQNLGLEELVAELGTLQGQLSDLMGIKSLAEGYLLPSALAAYQESGVLTDAAVADYTAAGGDPEALRNFDVQRQQLDRFNEAKEALERAEGNEEETARATAAMEEILNEMGITEGTFQERMLTAENDLKPRWMRLPRRWWWTPSRRSTRCGTRCGRRRRESWPRSCPRGPARATQAMPSRGLGMRATPTWPTPPPRPGDGMRIAGAW